MKKNEIISSSILKSKLKQLDYSENENDIIRVHRAISWLKCAEEQADNPDLKFISLWISFNACYADRDVTNQSLTERKRFKEFISKLVEYDNEKRIFDLLWDKFSGPVRLLIENRYTFSLFWEANRDKTIRWESEFNLSKSDSWSHLSHQRVDKFLEIVLDRLYTVRNQLLHGGATYESKVNRDQVKDAGRILEFLIPIIVDIMIENIEQDWGEINYPVIRD